MACTQLLILLSILTGRMSLAVDYTLFAPYYRVTGNTDKSESHAFHLGELTRHDIQIDPDRMVVSHYRSRLTVRWDCKRLSEHNVNFFKLKNALSFFCGNNNQNTSELNQCPAPKIFLNTNMKPDSVSYCFDVYSAGITNHYDMIFRKWPSGHFEACPTSGDFAWPKEDFPGDDPEWALFYPIRNHYVSVFMSKHHEMRLDAIFNDINLEPEIDCMPTALNIYKSLYYYFFPSSAPRPLGCVSDGLRTDCYEENAYKTRYSCLLPEFDHFPSDFDEAVENQEPLFLAYAKEILLDARLNLKDYATILPFRNPSNPLIYACHKKLARESDDCLMEEDPGPEDPTKIRYCRSSATGQWETITLYSNDIPILILSAISKAK